MKIDNYMVNGSSPYDKCTGPKCPLCGSTDCRDTRECPDCMEETEMLRCPKCSEKTNPVYICNECEKDFTY